MNRLLFLLTWLYFFYGVTAVQIDPLEERIIGGKVTTIEEHPYQLSLGYHGRHLCGATLIKPNVAVTSVFCTSDAPPNSLTVRAGTSKYGIGGQLANVQKICHHPKYSNFDYDVSVVLLDNPFKLDAATQTISLQARNEEVPIGTLATVTGWGWLNGAPPLAPSLQVVRIPRFNQELCLNAYPERNVTSRMNCYGYAEGGKSPCNGDSGGPLVVDGKLAGIASWGKGCSVPPRPTVYTNVAHREIYDHIYNCIDEF